jgi:hypothetical protein
MRVAGIPLGVGNNNAAAELGTVLWLKFEGANGSSVFVDSSTENNMITTVGTPIQMGGAGVFDGGGYIYTDTIPPFIDNDFLITGEFEIDAWPDGFQFPAIFGYNAPITVQPIALQIGTSGGGSRYKKLVLSLYSGVNVENILTHQTDISLNTLHSFKVERKNGVIKLYLDDVECGSSIAIGTESIINNATRFCIAKGGSTYSLYDGLIYEFNLSIKS